MQKRPDLHAEIRPFRFHLRRNLRARRSPVTPPCIFMGSSWDLHGHHREHGKSVKISFSHGIRATQGWYRPCHPPPSVSGAFSLLSSLLWSRAPGDRTYPVLKLLRPCAGHSLHGTPRGRQVCFHEFGNCRAGTGRIIKPPPDLTTT